MTGELLHPVGGRVRFAAAAICDGMGGGVEGERASAAAAGLPARLSRLLTKIQDTEQVPELLRDEISQVNRDLYAQSSGRGTLGTTVVLAFYLESEWLGAHLWIAWGGDSRAYSVSAGGAALVSADHSAVAERVSSCELTAEEAVDHPEGHLLTAAVGASPLLSRFGIAYTPVNEPLTIVLLTDGVWGALERAARAGSLEYTLPELLAVLVQDSTPEAAARQMVKEAIRLGGDDNATAGVLIVGGIHRKDQ